MMKQIVVTPAAGKRLIAKAIAVHPAVQAVLKKGTLVIVAGTSNGYVAEEILGGIGHGQGFSRRGFRRGMTVPSGAKVPAVEGGMTGDVIIVDGQWVKGKTIFDVVDSLQVGDVILKGGNALDVSGRRAAVQIGDPQCGTAGAAIRAVVGRRVRLIVPIGLEKRVADDIDELAAMLNAPEGDGPRLLPLPGEVFTEIDAVKLLSGADARLVAAGGVYGAEGAFWLAVTGSDSQVRAAQEALAAVAAEPPCQA